MPRINPSSPGDDPARTKTRDFRRENCSALHQAFLYKARSEVSLLNRKVEIHVVDSLDKVTPDEWNRLAGDNPFVRHEFLSALQDTAARWREPAGVRTFSCSNATANSRRHAALPQEALPRRVRLRPRLGRRLRAKRASVLSEGIIGSAFSPVTGRA